MGTFIRNGVCYGGGVDNSKEIAAMEQEIALLKDTLAEGTVKFRIENGKLQYSVYEEDGE